MRDSLNRLLKKYLKPGLVAIAFLTISILLKTWATGSEHETLRVFVPELAEFMKIAAYLTLFYMFTVEVLENLLFPMIRTGLSNVIFPELTKYWNGFGEVVALAIKNKEITFGESIYAIKSEQRIDASLLTPIYEETKHDPKLKTAYDFLRTEHYRAAVSQLEDLSKEDKKYCGFLITALIMSPDRENWQRAEKLLPDAGTMQQYKRLAFSYWANKDTEKAISLAEKAYENAKDNHEIDPLIFGSLKNSLAYYYADGRKLDKQELAKKLAKEEVNRRFSADPHSLEYWDALDTLGYVEISYATTSRDLMSGLEKCIAAAQGGAKDLYQRHITRYQERFAHVKND